MGCFLKHEIVINSKQGTHIHMLELCCSKYSNCDLMRSAYSRALFQALEATAGKMITVKWRLCQWGIDMSWLTKLWQKKYIYTTNGIYKQWRKRLRTINSEMCFFVTRKYKTICIDLATPPPTHINGQSYKMVVGWHLLQYASNCKTGTQHVQQFHSRIAETVILQ